MYIPKVDMSSDIRKISLLSLSNEKVERIEREREREKERDRERGRNREIERKG